MNKKNKPQPPAKPEPPKPAPEPNLQLTPVEFSPIQSDDAVGTIVAAPRVPFQYPVFVPIAIVLLTLNYSAIRDIVTLNKRMATIEQENAAPKERLKESGKQLEFRDSLREGITKLAETDPVAAKIAKDFFPKLPEPPSPPPPAKPLSK